MKRIGIALLALALLVGGCGDDEGGGSGGDGAKVAIVKIAEAKILDEIEDGFREGFVRSSGLARDKIEFVVKGAQGDHSLVQNLARELPRDGYDLYAAIGTPLVQALHQSDSRTPIIAPSMTDPVGAGVAKAFERPQTNVTGTSDAIDPKLVAAFLDQVKPRPTRIGTVFDPASQNSDSFVKALEAALRPHGMSLRKAAISGPGDIASSARSLVGKVDAIAMPADAITAGAGLPAIAQTAKGAKLPLFLAAGADPRTPGLTAVLSPDNRKLGELAGELAAKVFRGADPAEQPFRRLPPKLAVNAESVRSLGLTLPKAVPTG